MRILILGTGTEIGKTHVTTRMAIGLRAAGVDVLAVKPVESGYSADDHGSSDAGSLEAACGRRVSPHPRLAFRDPVSPHLAARREGVMIDLADLGRWLDGLPGAAVTLIETAGGAFSPLSADAVNGDLAAALRVDQVLLVAADRLGVLHDVTATTWALAAMGVSVDVVVLNDRLADDASRGTNAAELRWLGVCERVVTVAAGQDDVAPVLRALGLG